MSSRCAVTLFISYTDTASLYLHFQFIWICHYRLIIADHPVLPTIIIIVVTQRPVAHLDNGILPGMHAELNTNQLVVRLFRMCDWFYL